MGKTVDTREEHDKQNGRQKDPHNEEREDELKDMTERLEAISVQQTSSQSSQKPQAYKAAQKHPHATERMKKRASSDLKESLEKVEDSLSEWFTIDTYRLLRGDEYVRQVLIENECTVENVLAAVGEDIAAVGPEQTFDFRSRYVELCRNLDLKELEEENSREETAIGRDTEAPQGDVSPVSNESDPFEKLQQEALVERLKISAYLQGKTEFDKEEKSSGATKKKSEKGRIKDIEERRNDPSLEPRIPLVDRYAQGALRRRIFHDQLDRVLPDLLQLLGILRRDVNEALGKFVHSFSLGAENVVLKPEEWTLVSIFLLKMVSARDEKTRKCLESPSSTKYLNMLLLSYGITSAAGLEEKIEAFHSNVHALLVKMKTPENT